MKICKKINRVLITTSLKTVVKNLNRTLNSCTISKMFLHLRYHLQLKKKTDNINFFYAYLNF